jgi:hypothetical protein
MEHPAMDGMQLINGNGRAHYKRDGEDRQVAENEAAAEDCLQTATAGAFGAGGTAAGVSFVCGSRSSSFHDTTCQSIIKL